MPPPTLYEAALAIGFIALMVDSALDFYRTFMRKKPGPKTEIDGTAVYMTVTVDLKTRDLLKVIGKGNISRGVRESARIAYERYQRIDPKEQS